MIVSKHCPDCNTHLYSYQGDEINIGPEIIECPACKRRIKSGRTEWKNMTSSKRNLFFVKTLWHFIFCLFIGFIISFFAVLLANYIGFIEEESNVLAVVILGIPLGLIFLYFAISKTINQIAASIERSRNNKIIGNLEDL
jgi:hypothetical protein